MNGWENPRASFIVNSQTEQRYKDFAYTFCPAPPTCSITIPHYMGFVKSAEPSNSTVEDSHILYTWTNVYHCLFMSPFPSPMARIDLFGYLHGLFPRCHIAKSHSQ